MVWRKIDPDETQIGEARSLYMNSRATLADIARFLGMSHGALTPRIKAWG